MFLNTKYMQAKNIVLSFLKDNKIDNVDICESFDNIDIFKLGTDLGFDIRGAFFPDDTTLGLLLVNETEYRIDMFNSNKLIVYKNCMELDFTRTIIAYELANYIFEKKVNKTDILVMGDMYNQERTNKNIMILIIANIIISPLTYMDSDIRINHVPHTSLPTKKLRK